MSNEGGEIRPHREPCENSSLCGKEPFWDHGKFHQIASTGTNSTTVPNWNTADGQPTTIPPYERWTIDESGGDSCEVHHCVTGDPDPTPPCAAWPKPYPTNTFASSGTNVDFSVCHKTGFKNVQARRSWHGILGWTAPEFGCITNLCSDGVTGYQAAQTTASQTKYLTATYDVHVRNHFDAGEAAGTYLNADKNGARTVNAQTGEITSSLITSEDRDSGTDGTHYVVSGGAGTNTDNDTGDVLITYASGASTILDSLDNDLHCGFPHFRGDDPTTDLSGFIAAWNGSGSHVTSMPLMTDPNSYSCSITSSDPDGDWTVDASFSRSTTVVSWHFTATQNNHLDEDNTWEYYGSITLSDANTSASVLADITGNLLSLWPLNDDKLYPWRRDLKVSVAPLVSRNETDPMSPLGFNVYTVDDLTSPIDDSSGNAPFSPGWGPTYDQRSWFDPNIYQWQFAPGTDQSNSAATGLLKLFDGSILGGPLAAGQQNFFDFGFIDVVGCCFTDPETESKSWYWYQLGWGMDVSTFNSNAGCGLPLNATQWNNFIEAVNKPQGAWIIHADKGNYVPSDCPGTSSAGDSGLLVACKYAEILEMWPSQNFALPAGDMKFFFDENHVFCATNLSGSGAGSTWSLTDPITGIAPPDETDFSGTWGGPVVGGFYSVSVYSGGALTLGSKSYDVPSNWASKSNSDEALCFGKVRFITAPALLGRIGVAPDISGSSFTFELPQPAFGMDSSTHQEQVDLWDASMGSVASNVTATRVDDSTFTTASAHPSAAYVTIHGAPAWYVNDTRPKGDYAVLTWASDFRSPGEYGRLATVVDCDDDPLAQPTTNAGGGPPTQPFASFSQMAGCLPFKRCDPRVVCISPNGETWANGTTYDFPESFTADEQYGAKWWGYVQSTMTDLFWQQPHRPCNIKPCAQWKMDGGICADDSPDDGTVFACPGDDGFIDGESQPPVYYYGHAPLVEARLTVPDNYGMDQDEAGPSLPSNVQIGWLSPVTNSTGDIALPPEPPGILSDRGEPAGAFTTWDFHSLLCGHLDCRFNYFVPGCDPNFE